MMRGFTYNGSKFTFEKNEASSWVDGRVYNYLTCKQERSDGFFQQTIFYNKGNKIFGSYISSDFPQALSKKTVEKLLTKFAKMQEEEVML